MARTMTLAELGLTGPRGQEAQVTGLSLDSRSVERGHLFGAMPGATIHGGHYIEAAVARGASWRTCVGVTRSPPLATVA